MSTGSTRWRDGGRGHGKAQLGQCGIERISLVVKSWWREDERRRAELFCEPITTAASRLGGVVMGDGEMKLGHRQKHEAGRADCLSDCCCLLIIVMVKLISAFCHEQVRCRGGGSDALDGRTATRSVNMVMRCCQGAAWARRQRRHGQSGEIELDGGRDGIEGKYDVVV
ncbi:hypothetical protein M0R45_009070 [Rubus argutus]|uniref:Uncharacterized protein n=1 Tax=Rubus argutus TaxID=59490 RepID=A0AAW1Y2Y1_RUBAR